MCFRHDQRIGLPCDAHSGQDPFAGARTVEHWINQSAFTQPCDIGYRSDESNRPAYTELVIQLGAFLLSGADALGFGTLQLPGPTFKRLDMSTFKDFQLSERFRLQFRAEFFNILNHPNFNAPGFGGNGVVSVPKRSTSPKAPVQAARLVELVRRAMLQTIRGRSSLL